jgi:hypothetical protein
VSFSFLSRRLFLFLFGKNSDFGVERSLFLRVPLGASVCLLVFRFFSFSALIFHAASGTTRRFLAELSRFSKIVRRRAQSMRLLLPVGTLIFFIAIRDLPPEISPFCISRRRRRQIGSVSLVFPSFSLFFPSSSGILSATPPLSLSYCVRGDSRRHFLAESTL